MGMRDYQYRGASVAVTSLAEVAQRDAFDSSGTNKALRQTISHIVRLLQHSTKFAYMYCVFGAWLSGKTNPWGRTTRDKYSTDCHTSRCCFLHGESRL
jgi:hypothetical protein